MKLFCKFNVIIRTVVRESKKASFIPGIEGLRTFSVIGVILFHLWPKVFAGGFAGVTVFFVISGFLMTRIILDELGQRGSFRLKRFYLRRFWRLYPAFIVMILLTITVLTLGFPEGLFGIRGTLLSNMFYVNNWYQILHSVSYFAASAHWPVFTHLWSLSVEAQFYFVWPIILIMILYAGEKKMAIIIDSANGFSFAISSFVCVFFIHPRLRIVPIMVQILAFFLLSLVVLLPFFLRYYPHLTARLFCIRFKTS